MITRKKIIGIGISNINSYQQIIREIKSFLLEKRSSNYITVNNVHTLIMAKQNHNYRKVIENAYMALPDGKPLSVYANIKYKESMVRITGPTLFKKILEDPKNANLKHFFFGSSESTLNILCDKIQSQYYSAIVVGKISPPYKDNFTPNENKKFLSEINSANPDIVWVSLGAPKQENWMYQNHKYLKNGLMIGVGAGFEYMAGNIKRAPNWMRKMSLEWFYRLIQEPRRLFSRYLISNSKFIYYIMKELFT